MKQRIVTAFIIAILSMLASCFLTPALYAEEEEAEPTFTINGYSITGNTRIDTEELLDVISIFTGKEKTSADVEKARNALEIHYQTRGFPAVMVNIPEQTVDTGYINLEVVESLIRMVRITGNIYHTMDKIKKSLPSLTPGKVLYVPLLQKELNQLNRNRDMKVAPVLSPGKEPGTIDVELKVKDRLPLHASLEFSDRYSANTSRYRLNGSIRYDNLWQKQHSLSFQYQTAPDNTDEVDVSSLSYVFPVPWKENDLLVFYGVISESDNAFGEGFEVKGEGNVFGFRYIASLPAYKEYNHNLSLGIDYKTFDETIGFQTGDDATYTPITYLPLLISYNGSLPDTYGLTQFSAGLNLSFRRLITDQREFEVKRYDARGNFLFATLGLERYQKLPFGFGLFLKTDGQLATEPLISNEQYSAGGMYSVRSYSESEESGDNAFHFSLEMSRQLPEIPIYYLFTPGLAITPYIFYDYASLYTQNALEGQDESTTLSGAGCGLRGDLGKNLHFEVIWAVALEDGSDTFKNDQRMHFLVRYEF
ncbi:MAG: hypothetical protein KQH63_12085 [Desulfobulbaceae bacterium]|nr:hypothetical protein [Desulfobulbaceae bacterium]